MRKIFLAASASQLVRRPRGARPAPLVLALHCSGASGRQWQHLARALDPAFTLAAPDLIGCGGNPHWGGERAFQLADEARPLVALIDGWSGPVHLVGHSYGGGVALRIAVERPARIASLSLYEPTAFHVLKAAGDDERAELAGIERLAGDIGRHVVSGNYRAAARCFVDHWGGAGAFAALKPEFQANVVRYIPKACLDFRALIEERTPLTAYRRLSAPLRLMCGENAPAVTERLARKLAVAMNPGALRIVSGAGHLGPTTHGEQVAALIAEHIAASDTTRARERAVPTRRAA